MSTTPKLDDFIQDEGKSSLGDALAEIREHLQRIPVAEPTRYTSEAETRLIELCEQAESSGAMWRDWIRDFAAIKRDLGQV